MAKRMPLPKGVDRDKVKGSSEWEALYQAYSAIFKVQEIALNPQGISLPQLQMLSLLARERRPLTVGELARWMVKEPNSLTGLVDRAEAKGWVTTHGDRKDRRKRWVEFTRAGVRKYEETFAVSTRVGEKLFGKLSSAEMSQLKSACEKLRAAAVAELKSRPALRG